jgi:hypothetical protein
MVPEQDFRDEHSDGTTTVSGEAKVLFDQAKWAVHIHVHTKKLGIEGAGFGCAQLTFVDGDMHPFGQINANKTKGAVLATGIAEGDDDVDQIVLPAVIGSTAALVFHVEAQNSNGVPRSVRDLKEFVGGAMRSAAIRSLHDLPLLSQIKHGGVTFFRVR